MRFLTVRWRSQPPATSYQLPTTVHRASHRGEQLRRVRLDLAEIGGDLLWGGVAGLVRRLRLVGDVQDAIDSGRFELAQGGVQALVVPVVLESVAMLPGLCRREGLAERRLERLPGVGG